jgi:hypothetical protein
MERHRLDLLPECNGTAAPLDVFTRECCANCFNPECTRSLTGKLKFDQRVATWHERFFEKVPRMDPNDPRYPAITAQKFLTLDLGRTPEINTGASSSWVDPRDVVEPVPPAPAPIVVQAPSPPPVVQEPAPAPSVASPVPAPAPAQEPTPVGQKRRLQRDLVLSNTPLQTGKMIGQPPAKAPAADPWAAPSPAPAPDVPVVQPGARIKMGGGGV